MERMTDGAAGTEHECHARHGTSLASAMSSASAGRPSVMATTPTTELDARYGEEGAAATPWVEVERILTAAELYWLTTIRPEGGPHMTPLIGVYHDGAVHFCTGPEERKARNLAGNSHVVMSTGTNTLHAGTDVVVEGAAARVTDDAAVAALARAWEDKYGEEWHFDVHDGAFHHKGGSAHVYRVEPTRAYAFGKAPYSHTRYTFT
jgi:nitroimidazol reductase NimA-like FMN-containing flavoprotein (pyridoxamine 5'-phosphate oxidase superfamily)